MSQGLTSKADRKKYSLDIAGREEKIKTISKAIKPDSNLNQLPEMKSEQKRILLIVPPGTLEESYGRLSAAAGELPMLGLAFIAASLRDQGHIVKIIDYEVNDWNISRVPDDIREFSPDVVGMTAYITNMKRCVRVATIAKEVDPDITIILGGPQVTIFPEEAFHSPYIDMIVLSEGEIIIRNVMNALGDDAALANVKGIWFKDSQGKLKKNIREGLVEDLDIFPAPAWDLYDMERYYPPAHIRGKKVAHLLTSRGCPFKCTFCETKLTFGRSFRYHTTDRVLQDLEVLITMGYDSFQFYDDIFTANKRRIIDLCNGIIEKKWKIQWMCFTRTNCVNDEILTLMKKSGCYLITYGGESGDDELLALLKKGLTVKHNYEGIRLAKKHKILTLSSFMLGLPTETREQSFKTINFAIDSGLDYAVFPILEPYPGTELWVDAQQYGFFDTTGEHSNNLLSENSAVWVPNGRSRKELEELSSLAMKKFYLRPNIIFQGIKNVFLLPYGRALRFFWSGIKFFSSIAKPGTRY